MKHLTTHQGVNNRTAEVYIVDEQTYCVYCYVDGVQQTYIYVDTFTQAENQAESFVAL
jgi:hypothetical protein